MSHLCSAPQASKSGTKTRPTTEQRQIYHFYLISVYCMYNVILPQYVYMCICIYYTYFYLYTMSVWIPASRAQPGLAHHKGAHGNWAARGARGLGALELKKNAVNPIYISAYLFLSIYTPAFDNCISRLNSKNCSTCRAACAQQLGLHLEHLAIAIQRNSSHTHMPVHICIITTRTIRNVYMFIYIYIYIC